MNQETKDFALLHVIVLVWGFTAILGLLVSIPSVELVFYRTGFAAIGLWFVLKGSKRSFWIANRQDWAMVISVGFLIAAHWILFFLAARVANASVCLAGMATTSLWTSLLEPIYFKKKVQAFEVVLSLLAFAGMIVIFNIETEYVLGLSLAVLSAFLAACFTVLNASLTRKYDHFVITFYEMTSATILIAIFFPIYVLTISPEGLKMVPDEYVEWAYILTLAILCTVWAYSYSIKLMKRLSAFAVNLTVNLEPVYGIILALLIFGESEKMSGGFYIGTGLIMLAVLLYPLLNRISRNKAVETDVLR
jgi:drug/metabolite transporter (DMT)-like permease